MNIRNLSQNSSFMIRLFAGLLLTLAVMQVHAAPQVGETVFARGAATAQQKDGGDARLLGNGSKLYQGDVISTGRRSFAILKFKDGTRMTLRPNSVFAVEKFDFKPQAKKKEQSKSRAILRLFKGGLRAVTGLISKRNPNGFRIRSAVATIGIRGTDFSVRVCGKDCAAEASKKGIKGAKKVPVVGRIAFARGELTGKSPQGKKRRLLSGAAVYQGDMLETGARSIAVLAFRDKSRVTLKPDTQFQIKKYVYDIKKPARNTSALSLFRGGLRAVTGLINKNRRRAFRVNTPVGTIGIRGTGFDLLCQGDCVSSEPRSSLPSGTTLGWRMLERLFPSAVADGPGQGSLFIQQWQGGAGSMVLERPGGDIPLPPDSVTQVLNTVQLPRFNASLPPGLANQLKNLPKPTQFEVKKEMFETKKLDSAQGLIVSVHDDGHATIQQEGKPDINIGKNESVHADARGMNRIEGGVPKFIDQDPYNIDPQAELTPSLLNDTPDAGDKPAECEIK